MKAFILFSMALILVTSSHAQNPSEISLQSKIESATVFLKGAQVFRQGTIDIPSGQSTVVISDLTPFLDPKSIRVRSEDATILSVQYRHKPLEEIVQNKYIDSVQLIIDQANDSIQLLYVELAMIKEKEKLILSNQKLGSQTQGPQASELVSTLNMYDEHLLNIKRSYYLINQVIGHLNAHNEKLNKNIESVRLKKHTPTGEITLELRSETNTDARFDLSYYTDRAGWIPKYDIRAKNIESPIDLTYRAQVFQKTGVDWTDVNLTFSNGNPSNSGVAPVLKPWKLNYARNTLLHKINQIRHGEISGIIRDSEGEPLIGVNIVIRGSTIGTITDIDGRFSLTLPSGADQLEVSYTGYENKIVSIQPNQQIVDITLIEGVQLDEVVVTSLGTNRASRWKNSSYKPNKKPAPLVTSFEYQTTVDFTLKIPYSLPSDHTGKIIDMITYEVPAEYQYTIIPKMDQKAYLLAKLKNWNQYNLLSGEANVYFENTFIGKSLVEAEALSDILNISLGADRSITIQREKIRDFSKKQFLGNKRKVQVGHKITVRNNKSQSIKALIIDQIPVSVVDNIEVDVKELTDGNLNKETGIIKWPITIASQDQQEWIVKYEVKHPKREGIYLE